MFKGSIYYVLYLQILRFYWGRQLYTTVLSVYSYDVRNSFQIPMHCSIMDTYFNDIEHQGQTAPTINAFYELLVKLKEPWISSRQSTYRLPFSP